MRSAVLNTERNKVMHKLLYGLEGAILHTFTGSFQDADNKADDVMLQAAHDLTPGGEHAGKTFVVVLIDERGGLCYARRYTVSG
jgi:hypothetical protein